MTENYETTAPDNEHEKPSPADFARQQADARRASVSIGRIAAQLDEMRAFTHPAFYATNHDDERLLVATVPLGVIDRRAAIFVNRRHRPDLLSDEEHCDSVAYVIHADEGLLAGRGLARVTRPNPHEIWDYNSGAVLLGYNYARQALTIIHGNRIVDEIQDQELDAASKSMRSPQHMMPFATACQRDLDQITPYLDRYDGLQSVTLG